MFPYHPALENITITMPDDLARKVRVMAAETDSSMSQFLCRLIAEKAVAEDHYAAAMRRYLSRDRGGLRLDGRKLPAKEAIHDRDALR